MKKTGSEIICELLKMYKIKTVAGIPGGSILPLYDELARSGIRHILVRQEQAAGFIAQGEARTKGTPAVCMATSGPGAMNLLTAIADARADSIPIIAITGQVNLSMIGTDAFQEADTFGLSFPITKHSIMVKSASELLTAIPAAFEIATNGRPGPVLIDVPRNVQLEVAEFSSWPKISSAKKEVRFATNKKDVSSILNKMLAALSKAKKPVLYLGGGTNSPAAAAAIRDFIKNYPLPVASSLMALGVVAATDPLYMGMVGMHGSVAANRAVHDADLLFAAGVRFDDRAIGLAKEFCPGAKIIHIDIDAAEVNKIFATDISLVGDVASSFIKLNELLREKARIGKSEEREAWKKEMCALRKNSFSTECGQNKKSRLVNPRSFIAALPYKNTIVTTDVGQHQMWAAQYYPVQEPRSFLTSGSLGTMGFGLPAAIGAALANPGKKVVCISGDGSIMMNIQELATLAENNLNVCVIVFENGTLGMVRQQQKYIFEKNFSASVFAKSPDLLEIARGFGIEAFDADKDADWQKKVFDPKRASPAFVRVRIDADEDVLPYVMAGKANIDSLN